MRERNTKPWYQRARCIEDDPVIYEVSNGAATVWDNGDSKRKLSGPMTVASRCDHCPVAQQCAQDAVLTKDHGMIRAGIPVPIRGETSRTSMADAARIGLLMVAGGIEPKTARSVMIQQIPAPRKRQPGGTYKQAGGVQK